MLAHLLIWSGYLKEKIKNQPFYGINWQGLDKNMLAHNSKEEYIKWFCALPPYNEPYRDKNFYVRELTMLSSWVQPRFVVEIGTNLGMGTALLARLNPLAEIYTVDILDTHPHELGNLPNGYLAGIFPNVSINVVGGCLCPAPILFQWGLLGKGINFCFIDGKHTREQVIMDSGFACDAIDFKKPWAIIWHDYNPEHPDLGDYCKAIEAFTNEKKITAYHFNDGATLWAYGGVK